ANGLRGSRKSVRTLAGRTSTTGERLGRGRQHGGNASPAGRAPGAEQPEWVGHAASGRQWGRLSARGALVGRPGKTFWSAVAGPRCVCQRRGWPVYRGTSE